MVHGGPDFGGAYLRRPLARTLGSLLALHFFDQRGTGEAERTEAVPASVERMALDLDLARRHFGLGDAVLVAHSFGALVALTYAERFASRVRALVLIDPDPPTRSEWEAGRRAVGERRSPADAAWLGGDGAAMRRSDPNEYYRVALRPYFADPATAARLDLALACDPAERPDQTGQSVRADLGDWDLRPRLGGIAAPTLVVTGSASVFTRESLDAYQRLMPDCRMVALDRAGHFPHMERPRRFRNEVTSFLKAGNVSS